MTMCSPFTKRFVIGGHLVKRLCCLVVLGAFVVGATARCEASVNDAADYLVSIQLANGGWSWENGGTSASNITGATGIGLVRYYNVFGGSAYLDAAKKAGDYVDASTYDNGETRFATFDPYFCRQLSLAASDSKWSDIAATKFFDALSDATYGTSNYDTAGWISAVQTARTGTWVNLRPWEFSTLAVTAGAIGNAGQEGLFRQAILDGLDTLDNTSPDTVYSDLIGVSGGLRGLALDGVTTFSINSTNHSGINGIGSLSGLADYLAGKQNSDGSWYWHSNLDAAGEGDKDTQTTAYAVLALEAAAAALDTSEYDDDIAAGRAWIGTMQDSATGGYWSYPGDAGDINNEVTGEALAATAVPEPVSIVIWSLIFGLGLGLAWWRRHAAG